ncbi:MAG: RNA-binding cell elongation regulator Jag/EloR [Anaerolineae bacterium]
MLKQNESLDVSAKTVEEAIEQGLAQAGLSREQVDIEVIKEGKRGVFGIGAEEAQIRLTLKKQPAPTPPQPAYVPPQPSASESSSTPSVAPVPEATPISSPEPQTSELNEVEQLAISCLEKLLKFMGIQATVTHRYAPDLVEGDEAPPLVLDIVGGDLGILIGRQSETLQALQFMVRTMVSKQTNRWHSIMIDVESYRARRRSSLQRLAERMAERAASSGKKVVLEAMPAHERRIIHLTLRDHPAVITKSVGSDDNRKVTIIPK